MIKNDLLPVIIICRFTGDIRPFKVCYYNVAGPMRVWPNRMGPVPQWTWLVLIGQDLLSIFRVYDAGGNDGALLPANADPGFGRIHK